MTGLGWTAWVWLAAPWYVDGDATTCPGEGSDAAPFCTIQEAFDNVALAAGDEILVRDAAAAYAGASIYGVDGSASASIVLRPDDGHAPIVGDAIEIGGSSYWTVRGLTFHGQGGDSAVAIIIDTSSEISEGIVIEDNTILDWGGALVTVPEEGVGAGIITVASYPPSGGPTMIDPVVRRNRVLGGRGKGIRVSSASGAVIEGNEVADLACQMETNGPGISGIHVYAVGGAVVARNRIRDFDATDCSLGGDVRVIGVWVQSADGAEVHHNLVERMGGLDDVGMGIDLIQGADDCSIHHNIVVAADQCGLCNGTMGSSGGARARFVNNTVIGGMSSGLELIDGEDSEFLGNVVVGAGRAQARILVQGVATWTFDNNLYFPPRGRDNVGRFDYAAAVDFATWQKGCDCDATTIVDDPRLPPVGTEDFTPASDSPAIDRGVAEPEADRYNGRAPDLGAVEAPIALQASIAPGEPATIRLDVQSETSALRHDPACAGFTALVDGRPVPTAACELDGDDRLLVHLQEPAHTGDVVVLAYEGWSLGNRDAIGGVVDGLVRAFELDVDNASEDLPPAGDDTSGGGVEGSGTSTATAGDASEGDASSDGTGAGAGDYPGLDGCGCHQRRSGEPILGAWLVVALGWRRRTIA